MSTPITLAKKDAFTFKGTSHLAQVGESLPLSYPEPINVVRFSPVGKFVAIGNDRGILAVRLRLHTDSC